MRVKKSWVQITNTDDLNILIVVEIVLYKCELLTVLIVCVSHVTQIRIRIFFKHYSACDLGPLIKPSVNQSITKIPILPIIIQPHRSRYQPKLFSFQPSKVWQHFFSMMHRNRNRNDKYLSLDSLPQFYLYLRKNMTEFFWSME